MSGAVLPVGTETMVFPIIRVIGNVIWLSVLAERLQSRGS